MWKGVFRITLLSLTLLGFLGSRGWAEGQDVVAVAASMAPAVEHILAHQKELGGPGKDLEMVSSSSGKFARQIEGGAPYGLFLSANEKWVRYLEEKGFLENPRPLVQSPLVLWWNREAQPSFEVLQDLKCRIAVADPENAPIGAAGKKYLESRNLWKDFEHKGQIVITGDILKSVLAVKNNGATLCFVTEGTARRTGGNYLVLEGESPRYFGGIITKHASQSLEEFWNFLHSPKAAPLWKASGFYQIH